jgi:hypothetical protein
MCVQCMMGAMTAGAAATGTRAWLARRLGPRALKRATVALLGLALLAAATLSGSAG